MGNLKRSNAIWLLTTQPGNAEYKCAVHQAVLHFPLRNTAGAPQRNNFPEIPDQPVSTPAIELAATADAALGETTTVPVTK